jgi:hypothetical protein
VARKDRPALEFLGSAARLESALEFLFGPAPGSADGSDGDIEGGGGFFLGHACEVAAFDDLDEPGIRFSKFFQDGIDRQILLELGLNLEVFLVEFYVLRAATPFGTKATPRIVYGNMAHGLGCDPEEMGAVVPVEVRSVRHLDIGFVNQSRRVQGCVSGCAVPLTVSQEQQFLIECLDDLVEGGLFSLPVGLKEAGDVAGF